MPLCEGNVDHLFEPFAKAHKCHSRPTVKDPRWLPDFIDQVLSGLSFLQQKKMLHQDLKPDNVLYTLSSNANVSYKFMLSDFGLAVCKREGGLGRWHPGRARLPGARDHAKRHDPRQLGPLLVRSDAARAPGRLLSARVQRRVRLAE